MSGGMPDLSGGIIADIEADMAVHGWQEWPISGDAITTRPSNALIHLVDWVALGAED